MTRKNQTPTRRVSAIKPSADTARSVADTEARRSGQGLLLRILGPKRRYVDIAMHGRDAWVARKRLLGPSLCRCRKVRRTRGCHGEVEIGVEDGNGHNVREHRRTEISQGGHSSSRREQDRQIPVRATQGTP